MVVATSRGGTATVGAWRAGRQLLHKKRGAGVKGGALQGGEEGGGGGGGGGRNLL